MVYHVHSVKKELQTIKHNCYCNFPWKQSFFSVDKKYSPSLCTAYNLHTYAVLTIGWTRSWHAWTNVPKVTRGQGTNCAWRWQRAWRQCLYFLVSFNFHCHRFFRHLSTKEQWASMFTIVLHTEIYLSSPEQWASMFTRVLHTEIYLSTPEQWASMFTRVKFYILRFHKTSIQVQLELS